MKLPDYITKEEVGKVCKELKIRDWTMIEEAKVQRKRQRYYLIW